MNILQLVWFIPALPMAGCLLLTLLGHRLSPRHISWIGVGSVAAAAGIAGIVAVEFVRILPQTTFYRSTLWLWIDTAGMTVDQATRFFMDNAYMGETPSRIEAERGTFDPTYLVYSVGKLALLKLREDYKRDRKGEFSLQEFHDRILSNGNAPLWVHRQILLPGGKGKLIE